MAAPKTMAQLIAEAKARVSCRWCARTFAPVAPMVRPICPACAAHFNIQEG